MCRKDFNQILFPGTYANLCACNSLANIPVSPVKGRWTTIERIAEHGAFLYRPFREYSESASKNAAEIELAIRQDVFCFLPDASVVLLSPALLQSYNMRYGLSICDPSSYLRKSFFVEF